MTAKEAIKGLKNLAKEFSGYKPNEEMFDMAIEALSCSEISNSSDCIDRAEAQTAIQFVARRYTVAHEAHGEGHVVWSDNLISVTDAMNALRELPSAQPERKKGKWIWKTGDVYKCSECETETHVDECFEEPIYNYCPYCNVFMDGYER